MISATERISVEELEYLKSYMIFFMEKRERKLQREERREKQRRARARAAKEANRACLIFH